VVTVRPMAHRSAEGIPIREEPSPSADAPSWSRVGVIAALGFIVGVAWPRLAGVRLGPSLPDVASSPVAAMSASAPAGPPTAEALSVGAPQAVEVATPPAASSIAEPSSTLLSAQAAVLKAVQVEWEVALVRDAPKTGKVLARLPRGTSIRVGPAKDGWYPVKYGSTYSSDGWVYRGAIGR
jgi:hypothetical protein